MILPQESDEWTMWQEDAISLAHVGARVFAIAGLKPLT